MDEEDIRNSKYLSFQLRHGIKKNHLPFSSDGFVPVNSILNLSQTKNKYKLSVEIIKNLLEKMDWKRFELKQESDGNHYIRAVYGHSTPAVDYDATENMRLITDPQEFPLVIRHMEKSKWLKCDVEKKGIEIMNMPFAIEYPADDYYEKVQNKVNYVVVEIDIAAAMDDGMKFFISEAENYILTPRINGVVLPKYFKKVTHFNVQND